MPEIIHRPHGEFLYEEESVLKLFVVRGLKKICKTPIVFSGFSSACLSVDIYSHPYKTIYALDNDEWNEVIKYGGGHTEGNPFAYAGDALLEEESPAIGAYDATKLDETSCWEHQAKSGLTIVEACLRVVVWDK